jgi:ankyrin repeat protein
MLVRFLSTGAPTEPSPRGTVGSVADVPPDTLARYSRYPEQVTADGPAGEFLRLACLTYSDEDDPARWTRAREILRASPGLAADDIYVAAATADTDALRRVLAGDLEAAGREGGPLQWTPLCYLAYARHDPDIAQHAVLEAARLLLDAGADPNDGYLWHGLVPPFTVLTGVFGEGELGPVRQPRHPHSLALARVLLEAGADPNDGQALYNRMFQPGNDHLELLVEFGLGSGDGGPWRRLLGDALDTPAVMVRGQLAWAITHGMTERLRLLVARTGIDVAASSGLGEPPGQVTWTALAATTGHRDLVDYLVAHGAPPLDLAPADAFVAAALASDREWLDGLLADAPGLLDEMRAARPALMTWAAAIGSIPAVELLAEFGFDVNAMGRTDMPSDQPWQTALHKAAGDGNLHLATALLRLGADPAITDARFNGTPLDWARYFGQPAVADLLADYQR